MHAEGGSFAAFGSGAQGILGYPSHRIHHRIAELKELILLFAHEWAELPVVIVPAKDHFRVTRRSLGFLGGNLAGGLGSSLFRGNFLFLGSRHKSKGGRLDDRRNREALN